MAVGWTHDDAITEQISQSINDEITRARNELPKGDSLLECEECGLTISEKRRKALPGVRLCLECQSELEKKNKNFTLFNRRASKDSQLR
jgi:phage/conjugal plasmid C-4 type zinc finger TraR family protein